MLTCLRGALPPVDLRAVCLVRAMLNAEVSLNVTVSDPGSGRKGRPNRLTPRRCRVWWRVEEEVEVE